MTHNKIKQILDNLNTLQEELLALADDIHLGIDPRDNESVKQGYEFLTRYNDNISTFSQAANVIENQIKSYYNVNPETDDLVRADHNKTEKERLIMELDKTQAYTLGENFTYKRPYGYVFGDVAVKGIKTWKSLYLSIIEVLSEKDPDRYRQMPTAEEFATSRGNRYFSFNEKDMRIAQQIKGEIYAEINLSANYLVSTLIKVLAFFGIAESEVKVYLREDRDAG